MNNERPLVLVVGAAGAHAGFVVPELVKRGARVRGLVHDAAKQAAVRERGATEVAVADLNDRAGVAAALRGVDATFYIAPVAVREQAEVGLAFVAAAKEAGVRRFVFSGVIHPMLSEMPHHTAKLPVEDAVLNTDMEFCFLRPTVFYQNYAGAWPRVKQEGVLAEPWSNDTRFSRVDYRDVAEVAAIALTEERLVNGSFELCGAPPQNRHEVAALCSEVLGKPVRAERAERPKSGPMAALTPMFDWYERHGLIGNALTLRAILQREPRSLRAYVEELART